MVLLGAGQRYTASSTDAWLHSSGARLHSSASHCRAPRSQQQPCGPPHAQCRQGAAGSALAPSFRDLRTWAAKPSAAMSRHRRPKPAPGTRTWGGACCGGRPEKRCRSSWQILRYDWDLSGAPSLAQSRMRFFSRYLPSTLGRTCGLAKCTLGGFAGSCAAGV